MRKTLLGLLLVAAPLSRRRTRKNAARQSALAALGAGRRARHGEPDRARHLPALLLAHGATRRPALRAVAAAQRDDAAFAVRRALRSQAEADLRHPRHRACVQFRADERKRGTGAAGHADGCAGPFRLPARSRGTGSRRSPPRRCSTTAACTQKDVKPTPDSPLLKLGMDKIPPIITSAVLLDAKAYKKKSMEAGELVSAPTWKPC